MSRRNPVAQQQNDDTLPWIPIILCGAFVLGCYVFRQEIATVVMWMRYVQAHLMVFDPEGRVMIAEWLGRTTAAEATFAAMFQSGQVAGHTLRWPVLLILVCWFTFLFRRSPARRGRFSKSYDINSLARQEAEAYPVIKPVLDLGLAHVGLDDPLNGMRQTARNYALKHGLLLPRWTPIEELKHLKDVRRLDDKTWFLTDRAQLIVEAQIGRVWEGVAALRPYERTLFAAFAAQMCHDDKSAYRVLNEVAEQAAAAFTKNNPALLEPACVAEVLGKYAGREEVIKIFQRHAYVRTVLMRMLMEARKNGVLNAGLFRWLKMADRITWYCLCDLGLAVSSAESAGVRAQFYAERKARTALAQKMVQPAIDGLIEAINEFLDDGVDAEEEEDEV